MNKKETQMEEEAVSETGDIGKACPRGCHLRKTPKKFKGESNDTRPRRTNYQHQRIDIRKWFASMDERWTKAQARRAEELMAKAGDRYEQGEEETETEAEKQLRDIRHDGFMKLNEVI